MRIRRCGWGLLLLVVVGLGGCKSSSSASASASAQAAAPKPLTVIPTSPGGIIEYGVVSGATTLPAAMANVLSQVHQACGEKPSVGQVFRVKGSNSAGVFFTVMDHAQNRQLAGMVIAAQGGPNDMEAAVVSDATDKFAQTMNPMLQQLFAAWKPGQGVQTTAASGSAAGANAAGVALHTVTAKDNSASLSVPDGWTLNPASGQGAVIVAATERRAVRHGYEPVGGRSDQSVPDKYGAATIQPDPGGDRGVCVQGRPDQGVRERFPGVAEGRRSGPGADYSEHDYGAAGCQG